MARAFGGARVGHLDDRAYVDDDGVGLVVVPAATLAAAAHPPAPGGRRYLHLSTGARNPLLFGELHRIVQEYFQRDPLPARDRGTRQRLAGATHVTPSHCSTSRARRHPDCRRHGSPTCREGDPS